VASEKVPGERARGQSDRNLELGKQSRTFVCLTHTAHIYVHSYGESGVGVAKPNMCVPDAYACVKLAVYACVKFIGKVVFICLRVSVNLVYKFQGKPGTTTVKHDFNPNGLKFHRGSP